MKRMLLGVIGALVIGGPVFGQTVLQPIGDDNQWNLLVSPFGAGSVFQLQSGQASQVPIPFNQVFLNGFIQPTNLVSEFILRVGPGSIDRGCRPGTEDNDNPQTTVAVPAGMTGSVDFVNKELSRSRIEPNGKKWTNFRFSINKGSGLQVLAIQPGFVPVDGDQVACDFEILYRYKTPQPVVFQPMLLGASPRGVAPAAAPAAPAAVASAPAPEIPAGHKAVAAPVPLFTGQKVPVTILSKEK